MRRTNSSVKNRFTSFASRWAMGVKIQAKSISAAQVEGQKPIGAVGDLTSQQKFHKWNSSAFGNPGPISINHVISIATRRQNTIRRSAYCLISLAALL